MVECSCLSPTNVSVKTTKRIDETPLFFASNLASSATVARPNVLGWSSHSGRTHTHSHTQHPFLLPSLKPAVFFSAIPPPPPNPSMLRPRDRIRRGRVRICFPQFTIAFRALMRSHAASRAFFACGRVSQRIVCGPVVSSRSTLSLQLQPLAGRHCVFLRHAHCPLPPSLTNEAHLSRGELPPRAHLSLYRLTNRSLCLLSTDREASPKLGRAQQAWVTQS